MYKIVAMFLLSVLSVMFFYSHPGLALLVTSVFIVRKLYQFFNNS